MTLQYQSANTLEDKSYFLTTGFFSHNINQTKMCNTLVSDQIPSKPELYFVFSAH